MLKIPEKNIFISEIACSIVINCLLMVPFLCLSFTLSAVWWVDPSHSLCLQIHLCYIIYYDLTVSCAAWIDSHSLVLLSQTLIPHPCLIKPSIKQELFSWSFYNILCCFFPQVYVKMFRYTQMGDLNLLTKIIRNYFYFLRMEEKNSFPLTLFLYQFSSIYFYLFQRNISLLSTALLRNRKRMMLKWEQRERKYRRKEEREEERETGQGREKGKEIGRKGEMEGGKGRCALGDWWLSLAGILCIILHKILKKIYLQFLYECTFTVYFSCGFIKIQYLSCGMVNL